MQTQATVAAIVLGLLVLSAGTSDRTGRPGAVILLALSVVWLRINTTMEGVVLVRIKEDRGISGADLAGLAGALIALWRLDVVRMLNSPRSERRDP